MIENIVLRENVSKNLLILCELVIFWIYLNSDNVLRENVLNLFVKTEIRFMWIGVCNIGLSILKIIVCEEEYCLNCSCFWMSNDLNKLW